MKGTAKMRMDEELVKLAQTGDKQAMDELLRRYSGLAHGCAHGYYVIGGEREDLIQEGMIGLYHAIMDYQQREGGRSFKNFAYLCVSRKIIDAVKKSMSMKNAPLNNGLSMESNETWVAFEPSPEDVLILSDDRREFNQKMSRVLSDLEFKITTMYMDGMRCSEICEVTGKSAKSVDNAVQRSKKKLQALLNETQD